MASSVLESELQIITKELKSINAKLDRKAQAEAEIAKKEAEAAEAAAEVARLKAAKLAEIASDPDP